MFALVALLAVFLQAFVVQTHVHGTAAPVIGGYAQFVGSDAHSGQHVSATDEHRVSCSLCQTLASAGSATLPSATFVLATDSDSEAAIVALALAPRLHTHSWQSRAPPIRL